jgi:hypothetical protein
MITAIVALAIAQPVPEKWVDAVQAIETGGEKNPDAAVGDGTRAKGRFQFHKEAWADCTKVRKAAGLKTYPYSKATDAKVAREYATTWLSYLQHRLTKDIGRPANAGETWLAWNLGYEGFRRYGFQLAMVPDAKFIKAAKINNSIK